MLRKTLFISRLVLFFLCSYLVTFLSISIGFIGQFVYWLAVDSFGRREKRGQRKIKPIPKKNDNEYHVIVIGTGFSGLGLAIKMNRLGLKDYILIERHSHVGGTWYTNKYPGCACDVPSNLYSYSFEPNPNWSYFFSRQKEIWDYLEHCADKYDIRPHIRFNTTVVQLKWLDERLLWQVTTQSDEGEEVFYARMVMAATGPLSNAAYPTDIEDIDQFQGQMCHTSAWDETIDFNKKRVAVVGTGASAIQVVPEVQKMGVEKLYVFQRTPPWVIPRLDRRVTNFEKRLLARFPWIQKFIRQCLYWSREAFVLSFAYRLPLRFINQELVRHNLNQEVRDEELRKKVTPTWDLGCKRVLITTDWYPALQKPNVQLVTNRIKAVKANSIVTYDGDEYPVDIIIWSTGFQTQKFGIPVYGKNGRSLAEQWSNTTQAYRGMTVPNFPNFFLLLGPNSRLGHSSVLTMLEAQLKYVVEALVSMDANNLCVVSIKQKVHDEYNQWIQEKLKKSVWYLGGCHSWYQNAHGEVTTIWPDFTWVYYCLMRKFDLENYEQE